ncbi:5288_t:CDS:2, partial [Scutellospora calospora]
YGANIQDIPDNDVINWVHRQSSLLEVGKEPSIVAAPTTAPTAPTAPTNYAPTTAPTHNSPTTAPITDAPITIIFYEPLITNNDGVLEIQLFQKIE